jgi:methyl-accepting chemotaxis protein
MNIRQKMLLGASLLTLIPVAITAALMWQTASSLSGIALDQRKEAQLISLRDLRRQQITDEVNNRVRALQTLAAQRGTVDGYKQLKAAYYSAAKDLSKLDIAVVNSAMPQYVEKQFNPEFAKRNAAAVPDFSKAVSARDPNSVVLQHEYIIQNPNPLGQKEKMIKADTDFAYARAHATYHPSFERAQKALEYYDIFLIDTDTDNVIYTVFKELDFASKLSGDGISAKTKLAEAYNKVKQAGKPDAVYMSDFAPYLASYDDQAAFVAAPIFDGDVQIGVIAMQYPIDKITEVMSSNKAWKKIGLGDTGDAFIVGAEDKLMRTNARYMIENKESFLTLLADKLSPAAKAEALKKETVIGLVKVDSAATKAGAEGKEYFDDFTDYRGIQVTGASAPLNVQGLKWVLVSKIDQVESNADINNLNRSSLIRALLIGLGVVAVAGFLVAWFLQRFLKPISTLSETVKAVASGNTKARTKLTVKDEIGDLGRSFDGLLDDRIASLEKASKENETLNNSVIELLQTVFQLGNRDLTVRAPVTEDIIGTVASSINQLTEQTGITLTDVKKIADQVRQTSLSVNQQASVVEQTVKKDRESLDRMTNSLMQATQQLTQVASLSATTNLTAEKASNATQQALDAVDGTVKGMDSLRESISEMEKRFKRLGERSQEISIAVGLINTISERTHVLALNASMQAATAGEAGRGFVVVAEEVQRLSDSSRQATAQITQLVGNIQAETNETLFTVNRLISQVVQQSELAQRAGTQMTQTQETTARLVGLVQQIAAFSQQQTELAATLQKNVLDINQGTEQTSKAIVEQTENTRTLTEYSQRLTESVGQFKLTATV